MTRIGAQDDDVHFGVAALGLAQHVDPRKIGQGQVDQAHMHLDLADRFERLTAAGAVRDDLDVAVALQDVAETGAHDVVIVEQSEANDHRKHLVRGLVGECILTQRVVQCRTLAPIPA
jgi:hypothetical protein